MKKRKRYKLQSCLLKQELEYDEIYEDTWEVRENEWLPYVKDDVLSTAVCYARYTMSMEELTGFVMQNSLTLPSLANKHFNSLTDENDEPVYTHTHPFKKKVFVIQIRAVNARLLTNIIMLKLVIRFLILFQEN